MAAKAQQTLARISEHFGMIVHYSFRRVSEEGDVNVVGVAGLDPLMLDRAMAAWDNGLEFTYDDL